MRELTCRYMIGKDLLIRHVLLGLLLLPYLTFSARIPLPALRATLSPGEGMVVLR